MRNNKKNSATITPFGKKPGIVLVGGGGHCCSVIDVIETEGVFEIVGIIDIKEKKGEMISGYIINYSDEDLGTVLTKFRNFHIAVGHVTTAAKRKLLFDRIKKMGGNFPAIKSPLAYVSEKAIIGEGTIIMHRALVNRNAIIGENCIINTSAVIEHDATVSSHCHISTGAIVNGECRVGRECLIGSNAVMIQLTQVSDKNIIAAGTVVNKNCDIKNSLYAGNPVKFKKKL